MSILSRFKPFVPAGLHPPLRKCLNLLRGASPYNARVQREIETFDDINVQDVPAILHYWSHKHLIPMLQPFGFTDSIQCFRSYIARASRQDPNQTVRVLSIGAGTCASEINIAEWLRENSITNYLFECVDINPNLLEKG